MSNKNQDKTTFFSTWDFSYKNYLLFCIGIVVILVGYLLMSYGETTSFLSVKLSPIILVIGYCVIIPISIINRFTD